VIGPASHHRAVGGSLDEACSLEPRPSRFRRHASLPELLRRPTRP
jgi:hypothetical protein